MKEGTLPASGPSGMGVGAMLAAALDGPASAVARATTAVAETAAHEQRAGQRQDEDGQDPGGVGSTDPERAGEARNHGDDGREAELDQRLTDADGDDGGAGDIDGAGDRMGSAGSGHGGHREQCTLWVGGERRSPRGGRMAALVTVYSNVG